MADELRALLAERDELLREVNHWRAASGAAMPPQQARSLGQSVEDLLRVQNENFGTFPNGFGDNGTGDDHEPEDPNEFAGGDFPSSGVENFEDLLFQDLPVIPDFPGLDHKIGRAHV